MDRTVLPAAHFQRDEPLSGQLVLVKMEAADFLASCLVLPELIATVASYLNGSGLFRHDEHGFALALFPHTADVRIVVYYTHKVEANAGVNYTVVEHLCLVNGLAHSFGNEPAQVVISMKQMYPGYSVKWQTFGRNGSDYYPRLACSWLDLGSRFSPMCRVYFPGGGAIYRANWSFAFADRVVYDEMANDPIACLSMQWEPCARNCTVCQDPKFAFLRRFSSVGVMDFIDKCTDALDFKWIAQFCLPRNYTATYVAQ